MTISRLYFFAALAAALALAGCAGGLQSTVDTLSSPAATQAASNVRAVANAVECFIAVGSGATLSGLQIGNAKGQTTAAIIYTISATLCAQKGGTAGAVVTVPATQVVAR